MDSGGDVSVLKAFQSNIDDIRNLASCKVCLRPFYEPFILKCGHTFCYGCLRSWFCGGENRRKNRNCPECRDSVKEMPAPNYALRDLAHMFVERAELLLEGETLTEHNTAKAQEAQLLADDRRSNGAGLFKGIFKNPNALRAPIWDQEDHVSRCPVCGHEIEDGFCNNCGYDDVDAFSDYSEDDDSIVTETQGIQDGSTPAGRPPFRLHLPNRHFLEATNAAEVNLHRLENTLEDDYGETDVEDTEDDDNPFPWGFQSTRNRPLSANDDDDDDDEIDGEDEADDDDMNSFIDDDDPIDEDEDEDIETYEPRQRRRVSRSESLPSAISENDLYSEDGYTIRARSHGSSTRTVSPENDSRGVYDNTNQEEEEDDDDDEVITNYDESDEENPSATLRQIRGGRRIVFDDSDDVEELMSDGSESTQNASVQPGQSANNTFLSSEDQEDAGDSSDQMDGEGDENSEDEDEDDDDEDIVDATSRRIRSRAHAATGRSSTARQQPDRGYHPYARRPGNESRNRYSQSSAPRGRVHTTYVY